MLTAVSLLVGVTLLGFGVQARLIEPVVMFGVVTGAAPFFLAALLGSWQRWRKGPISIPSAPSMPASGAVAPEIPVPSSSIEIRRPLRSPMSSRPRRQISTRLPY